MWGIFCFVFTFKDEPIYYVACAIYDTFLYNTLVPLFTFKPSSLSSKCCVIFSTQNYSEEGSQSKLVKMPLYFFCPSTQF